MQNLLDAIRQRINRVVPKRLHPYTAMFLSVQFLTFLAIGVVNTLSTTVFATILDAVKGLLHLADPYRVTFILGYCLSLVLSFFLNTYLTFRQKPTWRRFVKFPVSYIPNFIIQYGCVWLFTMLGMGRTLAYLIAAVIGIPVTFLTMKLFVYKK